METRWNAYRLAPPPRIPDPESESDGGIYNMFFYIAPHGKDTHPASFNQLDKVRGEYIVQVWHEFDQPGVGRVIALSNPLLVKTPEEQP